MLASFIALVVATALAGRAALMRAKARPSLQPVRVRADRPRRFR